MNKAQVQRSLKALFVDQSRQKLPLDQNCQQWKVRFKFIEMQAYCWNCKKWDDDASLAYCPQCGCDYYSYMDLKCNEIAPIRKKACQTCPNDKYVEGSLNGKLQCQRCFYKSKGNNEKAKEIEQKLFKAIEQVKQSTQYKDFEEHKQRRGSLFHLKMMPFVSFVDKTNLPKYQPQIFEWIKNPKLPIEIQNQLWQRVLQKKDAVYKKYDLTI